MRGKTFAFVLAVVALISFPSFSHADSSLSLNPGSLAACPCDPFYYDLDVYSDQADVFDLYFSPRENFSYFLNPQVPVPASSTVKTTLVLNTHCEMPHGNYSFTVTAVGRKSSTSIQGNAIVKKCRGLELSMPPQQSVCAGSSQSISLSLRNNGVFEEQGRLVFDGLPKFSYYLADDSYDLNPGESKNFLLSLQPSSSTPPASLQYSVKAGSAIATAALDISSCSFSEPFKISITPLAENVQVCAGGKKTVSFKIKNEGPTGVFKLESSGLSGSFPVSSITVSGRSSREVNFIIDAAQFQPGNSTLTVEVLGPSASDSASVDVKVLDCPSVVFGDLQLCLGETGSIPFSFKNNNPEAQYYSFTVSALIPSKVEPADAFIPSNSAVSSAVFVTGSALGVYPVKVFANATLLSTPKIIVKACEQPPSDVEIQDANFTMEYGVWQKAFVQTSPAVSNAIVSLPSDLFSISASFVEGENVFFTVKPLRQGIFISTLSLNVSGRSFERQFSFTITQPLVSINEKTQSTLNSENGLLDNTVVYSVKNLGSESISLAPSSDVPNATFSPETLELNSGEEKELSLAAKGISENQTVKLFLSAGEKTYALESKALNVPSGSASTGFFTASRTIGLFALVVFVAIIALAFVLKKEFEEQKTLDVETESGVEPGSKEKEKKKK